MKGICEEIKPQLIDKFYGEMTGPSLRVVERHVAVCEACQQEERALRRTLAGIESTSVIAVRPELEIRLSETVRGARFQKTEGSLAAWWHRVGAAPIPAYQVVAMIVFILMGWSAGMWTMARVSGPRPEGMMVWAPGMGRQVLIIGGQEIAHPSQPWREDDTH